MPGESPTTAGGGYADDRNLERKDAEAMCINRHSWLHQKQDGQRVDDSPSSEEIHSNPKSTHQWLPFGLPPVSLLLNLHTHRLGRRLSFRQLTPGLLQEEMRHLDKPQIFHSRVCQGLQIRRRCTYTLVGA